MRSIEIIVSPAGETRVETKGFTDSGCRQASEFLEKALGERTTEHLAPEFYQTETLPQSLQEGT